MKLSQIANEILKQAAITANQVLEQLQNGGAHPDEVGKKQGGTFIARWGYFYHHGQTPEGKVAEVKKAIPGVEIVDSGDNFTAFKGGAPLKNQSHLWVIFKLPVGKDINLKDVNYDIDIKTVGNQVIQEIKDAGYETELKDTIKQFESGNINDMQKAYKTMYDFAKTKGIKIRESKTSEQILRIARKVASPQGLPTDMVVKKLDEIRSELTKLASTAEMVAFSAHEPEAKKVAQKVNDDLDTLRNYIFDYTKTK